MGIIGNAVGALGSVAGGAMAAAAMKKVQKNIKEQRKKNQDWFDMRYNEDATQRADAQRLLTMTEESIKNRNRQAAGAQAVMGGTEESVAATKAENNKALADTMSNIAVNADSRKDAIESQYMQNDAAYQQQLNDLELQKAQTIGGAVQGVANVAASMPF